MPYRETVAVYFEKHKKCYCRCCIDLLLALTRLIQFASFSKSGFIVISIYEKVK
jgi:hypothetical protein